MGRGKSEVPKSYGYQDIENKSFKILDLKNEWLRHLGNEVERSGSILIMGDSGHGKTAYAMQLMKELCSIERVFYNTAEEGMKASFRRSLRLNGLKSVSSKYTFQSELYDDMMKRLNRTRQAKIVFIDSIQYCFRGKKREDYHRMLDACSNTLFIGISHLKKGAPVGAIADEFYWDCQNRIIVEDFKAYVDKTRCGGDELMPYVISQQKAKERELKLLKKG